MKRYTVPLKLRGKVEKMSFQELVILRSYLKERNSHIKTKAFILFLNEELNQRVFNLVNQIEISEK